MSPVLDVRTITVGISRYAIKYNTSSQRFEAFDKDDKKVVEHASETELEIKLRTYYKSTLKFKPVEAIDRDKAKVVRITSRDANYPDKFVWISFVDHYGNKTREKTILISGWRPEKYHFFKTTKENLERLKYIQDHKKKIKELEDAIDNLEEAMTDPVTIEDLGGEVEL